MTAAPPASSSSSSGTARTLEQKLQTIYGLRGGAATIIRQPYRDLLAALGNPHLDLPPVIHIAGTNGKGSVQAFLRGMLEAVGLRVHVYTSPHLLRFNERIVLAGAPIADPALKTLLDEIEKHDGFDGLTFFEIATAAAFAAFARTPGDILLLETGLGGRLDCTNVVEHPVATVITPIGLDHTEILGHTLEKIAAEKAGIMKGGVPCIIGTQDSDAVMQVFEDRAKALSCPLYRHGREWNIAPTEGGMDFTFDGKTRTAPLPVLRGAHQVYNAGIALACATMLGRAGIFDMTAKHQDTGLRTANWPGRLQLLSPAGHGKEWELWIDGGHNESAAKVLAAQAATWRSEDARPLHMVIGMKNSKDAEAFLHPFLSFADSFTFTSIGEEKSMTLKELVDAARQNGAKETHHEPDLTRAVQYIMDQNPAGGRILITGSLYLVAAALSRYGNSGASS